jgi:hypothetical protein
VGAVSESIYEGTLASGLRSNRSERFSPPRRHIYSPPLHSLSLLRLTRLTAPSTTSLRFLLPAHERAISRLQSRGRRGGATPVFSFPMTSASPLTRFPSWCVRSFSTPAFLLLLTSFPRPASSPLRRIHFHGASRSIAFRTKAHSSRPRGRNASPCATGLCCRPETLQITSTF